MKKLLLSLILLTKFLSVYSQSWTELGGLNALAANDTIKHTYADQYGNIYAGGTFTNSSGNYYVAKFNDTAWSELGGLNALAANGQIYAIYSDSIGNIYTGGDFTNNGNKKYVAKWNGSTWSELEGSNKLNANKAIYSICIDSSGNIYAAGNFTNDSSKTFVAKWNGTAWSELGGLNALASNNIIYSICTDISGNIYAAGDFTNSSGNRYVAKWNGSTWSELGGLNALAATDTIFSICSDKNGNVFAAGRFTNTDGNKYVAKWNGTAWSELGGLNALAANRLIHSICTDSSGNIYAGGNFTNSSGNMYVAKWNGSNWSELGGVNGLAANGQIRTICTDKFENLYAGGVFTNSSGNKYVAKCTKMRITVNGQVDGASFAQGSNINWIISGIPAGGTINNQLWIDVNGNGIIDTATDILFVSFSQTDGVNNGNGPGDQDGLVNDSIQTTMKGLSFPVGHYIFYSVSTTGSATSLFSITPMVSPTFTVSGNVSKEGIGQPNITVEVKIPGSDNGNQDFGLTDSLGNYTVTTNIPSGTAISVQVPTSNFNSTLGNIIVSPSQDTLTLTSNVTGINFVLSKGIVITGLVTDTMSNPISNINVSINPSNGNNGGNGYNATTDSTGRYYIAVDTGTYTVQFGDPENPQGYLITYYNQQYIQWLSTGITVTTSSPDTIKNINAILKEGALITGTFLNNGKQAGGSINAYAYNSPGNALYSSYVDSTDNFYYLYVPPGTYTIQFSLQNSNTQVYYNQTYSWPGTAVTIHSLNDTANNINVDFALVPLPNTYSFIGTGNWNNPSNWQNNLIPPSPLPAGDSIVINNMPGGQCFLNVSQQISPGAFIMVAPGTNLIIPGDLKLQ